MEVLTLSIEFSVSKRCLRAESARDWYLGIVSWVL